jgi:3-oxoacyl-[acyl-carrier-protein] synthase-3
LATGKLTARIVGSGSYLPPKRLDNFALYEVDSIRENFDVEKARASLRNGGGSAELSEAEVFDLWSRQVTGIRERRVVDDDGEVTTEIMCAEAAKRALRVAGIEAPELDLIVVASLTASEEVPNVACTVGSLIGAPAVGGYVLNAACAGFIYALATGYSFVRSGIAEKILVVSGDALSHITDYSDPKTAVLFGDGAGAVVLRATDSGGGILGRPYLSADYSHEHMNLPGQWWLTEENRDEHLQMGGGARVLRQAVLSMTDVANRALDTTGLTWDDIDFVIPHQANLRITQGIEKALRLKKGRVIHTIADYGNMSASTVPITLDEVLRGKHGPVPDPARFVLTAVGGGYTSGAMVFEWSPHD